MNLPPQVLAALMQQMGAVGPNGVPVSQSVNGGGGVGGGSVAGSGLNALNAIVGGTQGGIASDMNSGSNSGRGMGQTIADRDTSSFSDLTAGAGDQPGTVGYSQVGQNHSDNPAGAVGLGDVGQQAFDVGGGTAGGDSSIPSGTGPGSATFGRDLSNLIQPGAGNLGYTIPRRPTNNMLRLDAIFPQTGLQPYNGPVG